MNTKKLNAMRNEFKKEGKPEKFGNWIDAVMYTANEKGFFAFGKDIRKGDLVTRLSIDYGKETGTSYAVKESKFFDGRAKRYRQIWEADLKETDGIAYKNRITRFYFEDAVFIHRQFAHSKYYGHCEQKHIDELKKGEFFLIGLNSTIVYTKEDYDRSLKKYCVVDYNDINNTKYLDGNKIVYCGFTF